MLHKFFMSNKIYCFCENHIKILCFIVISSKCFKFTVLLKTFIKIGFGITLFGMEELLKKIIYSQKFNAYSNRSARNILFPLISPNAICICNWRSKLQVIYFVCKGIITHGRFIRHINWLPTLDLRWTEVVTH